MPLTNCRFTNVLGGTADWLYPGPVIDLQSPASAQAASGTTYLIYAEAYDRSQWEIATGAATLSAGVWTFARTAIIANQLGTTAKINFSDPPQVSVYDTFPAIAANTAAITALQNQPLKSSGIQICRVYLGSDQTGFTTNVFGKVNFDTVVFDPASIFDAANHRIKPTVAGYYQVNWSALMSCSTAQFLLAELTKNGSADAWGSFIGNTTNIVNEGHSTGCSIVHMDGATDYLEVFVDFANATATFTVGAGFAQTFLSAVLVKAD